MLFHLWSTRATIHDSSIAELKDCDIPISKIQKNLMTNLSLNAITYLTCVVLNKMELENHQAHVPVN